MDRNRLERDTYEALKKYFGQGDNEANNEGKLLSMIPPEMLSAVVEMLVAPVMVTIVADYIIQKCTSRRVSEMNRIQLENLKSDAEKKIKKKMKKIGKGEKESKKMVQKVSAEITVRLEFKSGREMNTYINELEELLQTDGKLKEISVDKKYWN